MKIARVSQQELDATAAGGRGPAETQRREITVRGIVQGVGFRPFVYGLAVRERLCGWVRNDVDGVTIQVEGPGAALDRFLDHLEREPPPLARIESLNWHALQTVQDEGFRIEDSRGGSERQALISPDVATCDDCLRELFDPTDRRYRYPFINCTNCGPRFTITLSVPYDRPSTTMAPFTMCAACRAEYEDPLDRRFHAQPNACPLCGPQVRLLDSSGGNVPQVDPIARTAELIGLGAVVAIKGIGGYHLACDPYNRQAVESLRSRKARRDKPFALMASDLQQVRSLCRLRITEQAQLSGPSRPIVLLPRRPDAGIVESVAPRQDSLGVMLAYTPLHHLILKEFGRPLVMTSGNRSDEPIAHEDGVALRQLAGIADYFLVHDRSIHMRCDDSVVRVTDGAACPVRRSRGYAPAPLRISNRLSRHVLACGAHLNNTFCLAKDNHLFVSHHIGDLENYETLRSFRDGIYHFCRLFDISPALVAYDLHPEYLSSKYAAELEEAGLPATGVQHHHAHIAACLADNQRPLEERVIGVALDGTGYGTDGTIWGGEFFTGSIATGFRRQAHLSTFALPGGEAAIRQPWRIAVAWLLALFGDDAPTLPLSLVRDAGERNVHNIQQLLASGLNSPQTSSAGRLFDAVAALLDVPGARQITYEGQAAVELELAASRQAVEGYAFEMREDQEGIVMDVAPVMRAIVQDLLAGVRAPKIAARFHRSVAEIVVAACVRLREEQHIDAVALSGGTFQNVVLMRQVTDLLPRRGFTVYVHQQVPTNDGGICVGQTVLAEAAVRSGIDEEVGSRCA